VCSSAPEACELQERFHARLGEEDAGARLEQRYGVVGRVVHREAAPHFRRRQHLVWDAVLHGAASRAGDERTVGRADHQAAGLLEERSAGLTLQLRPQLVRAPDERYVERVLEVGLADDARAPVRGAECVRGRPAVEAGDAEAAAGELVGGGAPHGAEADDQDVVGKHGYESARTPPAWLVRRAALVRRALTPLRQTAAANQWC
jgi:hypothetical protein